MKSYKLFLIMIFLIIAAKGYTQQLNADQDKNNPQSGIITKEQESLNPSLISEDNLIIQESAQNQVLASSGQPEKSEASGSSDEAVSPTIIGSKTAHEQSAVFPVNPETKETGIPNPTEINPGIKKPGTN